MRIDHAVSEGHGSLPPPASSWHALWSLPRFQTDLFPADPASASALARAYKTRSAPSGELQLDRVQRAPGGTILGDALTGPASFYAVRLICRWTASTSSGYRLAYPIEQGAQRNWTARPTPLIGMASRCLDGRNAAPTYPLRRSPPRNGFTSLAVLRRSMGMLGPSTIRSSSISPTHPPSELREEPRSSGSNPMA
jgi:hypothetical protein